MPNKNYVSPLGQVIIEQLSLNKPSCLLIGENHSASTVSRALTESLNNLKQPSQPIILCIEGLPQKKLPETRYRHFLWCKPENQAYTREDFALLSKTDSREANFLLALIDQNVTIYGLENEQTDPTPLVNNSKNEKELQRIIQSKLPFLVERTRPYFNRNADYAAIQTYVLMQYGLSVERLKIANAEFSHVIKKVSTMHPKSIIISVVGAAHLPAAYEDHSGNLVEKGIQGRLEEAGLTVKSCYAEWVSRAYIPTDETGKLRYVEIPKDRIAGQ